VNTPDLFHSLKLLHDEYIPFPPFDTAIKAINRNVELYRKTGIAEHILIMGESGAGKSTLCTFIEQQYPRYSQPDLNIVPVLTLSVPPVATIASVAEEMLRKLGDPSPSTSNISGKTHRVITLCKACKVEVVMFDEAQHVSDRGQYITQYKVGDWLKSLIDKLMVPTVFVGLPTLELLLQVNEQLRRRFSKRLSLAFGQGGSKNLNVECFQIFQTLSNVLPIPINFSPYTWQELGERLYYASDGRVSDFKELLKTALELALEERESQISPELLERAFIEKWKSGIGPLNPFHSAFIFRRLDRKGEPFEKGRTN
jgi:energy-coupling factor transporter ATP-binding protein EcfA2